VELSCEGGGIVHEALKKGVLMNCTCGNVLRFVPPLVITGEDVDSVIDVLDEILERL